MHFIGQYTPATCEVNRMHTYQDVHTKIPSILIMKTGGLGAIILIIVVTAVDTAVNSGMTEGTEKCPHSVSHKHLLIQCECRVCVTVCHQSDCEEAVNKQANLNYSV